MSMEAEIIDYSGDQNIDWRQTAQETLVRIQAFREAHERRLAAKHAKAQPFLDAADAKRARKAAKRVADAKREGV